MRDRRALIDVRLETMQLLRVKIMRRLQLFVQISRSKQPPTGALAQRGRWDVPLPGDAWRGFRSLRKPFRALCDSGGFLVDGCGAAHVQIEPSLRTCRGTCDGTPGRLDASTSCGS